MAASPAGREKGDILSLLINLYKITKVRRTECERLYL